MRILLVNTYYYPNMVGGTEQSIKLLAEGLKEKGHDVFVLTGDKKDQSNEVVNGIKIIRLNLKNNLNKGPLKIIRKCLEFDNISIISEVERILDEIKPDIVHTNNLFYLSPVIWKVAKNKNIKVVHTLRDYWGVCPKTTLLNKQGTICERKKSYCKFHMLNYKNFSKYVDIVTSPSKFTLDLYKKNGIFNNCESYVVSNAIDIDYEKYNNVFSIKNDKKDNVINFLFIGTLNIHKGIKFLIESFTSIDNDNIRLIICGDGDLREYIKKISKQDNRVIYKGKVFGEEKENTLLESDVMIVPSIWYEPFGRVVIEGYKYAMPVIASKIGGINELLFDDISIGVKANDNDELRSAIEVFANRENIKKHIENNKKYLSIYEIDTQIDKFESIYCR